MQQNLGIKTHVIVAFLIAASKNGIIYVGVMIKKRVNPLSFNEKLLLLRADYYQRVPNGRGSESKLITALNASHRLRPSLDKRKAKY